MNLTLSLFRRELLAVPRRSRFYLKRATLVAVGGLVILWGLKVGNMSRTTTIGLQIFIWLSMSMLVVMSLVSALNASSSIMREKEQRTLGLLFLSDISSRDFILGKLFTSLFSTTMAILSALPLFLLAVSLGGVSARQILTAFAVLLGTVFLLSGLGLFAATTARNEKSMNGLLLLVIMTLLVFLPIAITLTYIPKNRPPPAAMMCIISPFVAMGSLARGRLLVHGLANAGVSVVLGAGFVLLAGVLLPGRVLSRERPPIAQKIRQRLKADRRSRKWVIPARISGNPVTWKDFTYGHGGRRATWLKFAVSTVVIGLIPLIVCMRVSSADQEETFNAVVYTLLMFSAAVFALGSVSHCGMAFNGEKKSRAMEILLTTTLTDGEIIIGKTRAVLLSLLPWLICMLVCALLVVLIHGDEKHFWEGASAVGFEYLSMWFGYSCLALWISLRYRKNLAFPICILVFLLWNTLGRAMIFSLIDHFSSMTQVVLMDVLIHLGMGLIFLAFLCASFRRLALQDAG